MASLVNFSGLSDFEEFRIADREHIELMLHTLQREQTPVYLFFSSDSPVRSRIQTVDAQHGDVVLLYTEQLAEVRRLNTSGIFVVADLDNTQIQYHVDSLAQQPEGRGSDYMIPFPDKLYLIQRRGSPRRPIPESDHVRCQLTWAGETRELPVLDISDEGLALLDIDGVLPAEVGEALGEARLRLPAGDVGLELNLVNRFSIYQPEQNQKVVRLGCVYRLPEPAGQERLSAYLQGLLKP